MKKIVIVFIGLILPATGAGRLDSSSTGPPPSTKTIPYTIVDTGQIRCYSNFQEITYPKPGTGYFGQDAQYSGNQPVYKNNGDGTVTDLNTGLMWTRDPGVKKTYSRAIADASTCRVGGYDDWRLPAIKELYSLILFTGSDPNPRNGNSNGKNPYIDTKFFKFQYGDVSQGERIIDSQFATNTIYAGTTMRGQKTMFGVNFADGRIKGYPIGKNRHRGEKKYYVLYVRGNTAYGKNDFQDNGNGTVTDKATGLMWMKVDSGKLKAGKMNWQQALEWAESLNYAGYSDWRLPNAKELQSIVDYRRSPAETQSAAIDPVFQVTEITNEAGVPDYPYYWTGTTHKAGRGLGESAVYICFGRAMGKMRTQWMDVHGAGAQRSDPKSGNPATYSYSRGPQGDSIRITNYVRCVRGGVAEPRIIGPKVEAKNNYRNFPRQQGRQPNQYRQQRPRPSGDDFIRRLDKDGDGKVSREEFKGPKQHFNHFDKNKDGYISKKEFEQGPPKRRRMR